MMVRTSILLFQSFALGANFEDEALSLLEGEALSLLQLQSKAQKSLFHDHPGGMAPSSNQLFAQCASFGNAADIVGTSGNWKTTADYGLCKCWGDTHCSHVPFDTDPAERLRNPPWQYHYQYNGGGASRYAKAADGSWEIQIWQCGLSVGNQAGVAVKVQGTVVEAFGRGAGAPTETACMVNGQPVALGTEVHLPNGFHFKCPTDGSSSFCATLDGQFLTSLNHFWWGNQLNQNLAVPWSVEVEEHNNVCYDRSSKDNPMINNGRQISETAVVPNEEVIFSQAGIARLMAGGACEVTQPPQTGRPVDPNGPADPKTICDENHPDSWAHVQEVCEPLRADHAPFYRDCLVDECLRADDSEEEEIEEIANEEENIDGNDDSCNIEDFILKDPEYSNLGSLGPDEDRPEGILYPDAAIVNGQPVNVRLTVVGNYQPSVVSMNSVNNGLGVVNMLCGTTADLQLQIESKTGDPVEVGSLALTVFDLDEGRGGKGKTTVTACGSTMTSGEELEESDVDGCPTVTSTLPGTKANNPANANGVTDDQRSRSVSFAFGQGSAFPVKIAMGEGSKGRNVLFALRPVVGC